MQQYLTRIYIISRGHGMFFNIYHITRHQEMSLQTHFIQGVFFEYIEIKLEIISRKIYGKTLKCIETAIYF